MQQQVTINVVDKLPDKVWTNLGNVDMSTIITDGNVMRSFEALATPVVNITSSVI